jgi:hypothetical protein
MCHYLFYQKKKKRHLGCLLQAKPLHPFPSYLLAAPCHYHGIFFHLQHRETSQPEDGSSVNLDGRKYKSEMQFQPKIKDGV